MPILTLPRACALAAFLALGGPGYAQATQDMRLGCCVRFCHGGGIGFGLGFKSLGANGANKICGFFHQSGGQCQKLGLCMGVHAGTIRQLERGVMSRSAIAKPAAGTYPEGNPFFRNDR